MCNCNNNLPYNPCNVCNQTPCTPPENCDCPVKDLSTDCVVYTGDDLPCSGITSGQSETSMWQQFDAYICKVIEDLSNMFTLKNIGVGAKIYKGIDSLGRKELRTITKTGNIITVTENPNEVSIGIDEEALSESILIDNIGTGVEAYKGYNVATNKHEFRTITQENQGVGESFLRDIQQNADELNVRVKTLVSDNLTITSTDEEVRIETPMTASIPALYVNDLYQPTYQEWLAENKNQNSGVAVPGFQYIGKGTLAQPFTDTVVYPLLGGLPTITVNTSIQNALDGDTIYSYVGSGTRLSPEKSGQKIIIQNNNSFYTFDGDFGYSNIKLKINSVVVSTISGYIINADNPLHFNNIDSATLEMEADSILQIQGLGFNNSGSNVVTNNFSDSKTISLLGEGRIECLSNTNPLLRYIINSDVTELGNNNDGSLTFNIYCFLYASHQGIYNVKGNSRIDIYGKLQSGNLSNSVDTFLKAFNQEGGTVRKFSTSQIDILGGTRINGITFNPNPLYQTIYSNNSGSYTGDCTNLFNKLNTEDVDFTVVSTKNGTNLFVTNIFDSPNLWSVTFRNNVFASGVIDTTIIDLTLGNNISSVNTVGNNIIESLTIHNDRAAALLAGRPLYSAYLKTNGNAYPATATWVRDIVLPA